MSNNKNYSEIILINGKKQFVTKNDKVAFKRKNIELVFCNLKKKTDTHNINSQCKDVYFSEPLEYNNSIHKIYHQFSLFNKKKLVSSIPPRFIIERQYADQ